MAAYSLIWLVLAVVVVLPWNQKHTGTWNKIKKWYNFTLAGVLLALMPMTLRYYSLAADPEIMLYFSYFNWAVESVALVLGGVGILGMCKNLLLK